MRRHDTAVTAGCLRVGFVRAQSSPACRSTRTSRERTSVRQRDRRDAREIKMIGGDHLLVEVETTVGEACYSATEETKAAASEEEIFCSEDEQAIKASCTKEGVNSNQWTLRE